MLSDVIYELQEEIEYYTSAETFAACYVEVALLVEELKKAAAALLAQLEAVPA